MLIVGTLLIIKPEIITGTLETTGALLRVAALLLGWLLFSFLVRRFVRPPVLRTGLIVVVSLGLLTMTVLPYFIDTRANDTLLTSPAGASTQGTPGTPGGEAAQLEPVRSPQASCKALPATAVPAQRRSFARRTDPTSCSWRTTTSPAGSPCFSTWCPAPTSRKREQTASTSGGSTSILATHKICIGPTC
ncbi:MAG: hypothetical protein M3460_10545 [Actinomycetota bacterium]|nr:hypothetical protein [Actinomycetota bacterium]